MRATRYDVILPSHLHTHTHTHTLSLCVCKIWWKKSTELEMRKMYSQMSIESSAFILTKLLARCPHSHTQWPFNTCKSIAGSAAMLVGGTLSATAFCGLYDYLGYFEMDAQRYASVLAMSVVATAVEALPAKGAFRWLDDNISVPLVTAILGSICLG